MALVLDISPRNIESIVYFSSFIVTEMDDTKKAFAIDKVAQNLEKAKAEMSEEFETQISDLEKDYGTKVKGGSRGFSAEEAEYKFKEKVNALESNSQSVCQSWKVNTALCKRNWRVLSYSVFCPTMST